MITYAIIGILRLILPVFDWYTVNTVVLNKLVSLQTSRIRGSESQALCHCEFNGSGPRLFCLPLPFKHRRHRVRSNPLSAARAVGGGATCTYFSYSESDEGMEASTITNFGLLLVPLVRTFLPPRSNSSDFAEISFWISSSSPGFLLSFPPFANGLLFPPVTSLPLLLVLATSLDTASSFSLPSGLSRVCVRSIFVLHSLAPFVSFASSVLLPSLEAALSLR